MSFYMQLGTAILVVVSLVFHKLHWNKTADLADQLKKQLGGS